MENSDSKYYYIDHYFSKSTEEFVDKVKKGSAVNGDRQDFKMFRIFRYFNINMLKPEKVKYILNHINIKIEDNILEWMNLQIISKEIRKNKVSKNI